MMIAYIVLSYIFGVGFAINQDDTPRAIVVAALLLSPISMPILLGLHFGDKFK